MQNRTFSIYATLLDSYLNYTTGKLSFEDLIGRINRKEFKPNEYMMKGTAFHKVTQGGFKLPTPSGGKYKVEFFEFPEVIVNEVIAFRQGGFDEVYCDKTITYGPDNVYLYGYIDTKMPNEDIDIKTTGWYREMAFYKAMQWRQYNFITGAKKFTYCVTDFNDVFYEEYAFNNDEENKYLSYVAGLVDFLKEYEYLITDKKIIRYETE